MASTAAHKPNTKDKAMFVTTNVIVDAVLVELGLVPGSGVQNYTEPQIVSQITTQFISLAEKRFWSHMMRNTEHNLDGIVGVSTTDLVGVRAFEDIEWIRYYPFEKHNSLRRLQGEVYVNGWRESFERIHPSEGTIASKIFKVHPASFNMPIMVRARRWPTFPFTANSVVPFDSIALQHLVSSNLLSKDGINPGEAARQFSLFNARYNDLVNNEEGRVTHFNKYDDTAFTVSEEVP